MSAPLSPENLSRSLDALDRHHDACRYDSFPKSYRLVLKRNTDGLYLDFCAPTVGQVVKATLRGRGKASLTQIAKFCAEHKIVTETLVETMRAYQGKRYLPLKKISKNVVQDLSNQAMKVRDSVEQLVNLMKNDPNIMLTPEAFNLLDCIPTDHLRTSQWKWEPLEQVMQHCAENNTYYPILKAIFRALGRKDRTPAFQKLFESGRTNLALRLLADMKANVSLDKFLKQSQSDPSLLQKFFHEVRLDGAYYVLNFLVRQGKQGIAEALLNGSKAWEASDIKSMMHSVVQHAIIKNDTNMLNLIQQSDPPQFLEVLLYLKIGINQKMQTKCMRWAKEKPELIKALATAWPDARDRCFLQLPDQHLSSHYAENRDWVDSFLRTKKNAEGFEEACRELLHEAIVNTSPKALEVIALLRAENPQLLLTKDRSNNTVLHKVFASQGLLLDHLNEALKSLTDDVRNKLFSAKNINGLTVLDVVVEKGNPEVIDLLVAYGASLPLKHARSCKEYLTKQGWQFAVEGNDSLERLQKAQEKLSTYTDPKKPYYFQEMSLLFADNRGAFKAIMSRDILQAIFPEAKTIAELRAEASQLQSTLTSPSDELAFLTSLLQGIAPLVE